LHGCSKSPQERVTAEEGDTIATKGATATPSGSLSEKDQREIQELYEKLCTAEAKLVGPDGRAQVLPNNLYSFLCRLLDNLKAGHSVTILQSNADLTTVEASKLLGVS
jgi:hypothetical protein